MERAEREERGQEETRTKREGGEMERKRDGEGENTTYWGNFRGIDRTAISCFHL